MEDIDVGDMIHLKKRERTDRKQREPETRRTEENQWVPMETAHKLEGEELQKAWRHMPIADADRPVMWVLMASPDEMKKFAALARDELVALLPRLHDFAPDRAALVRTVLTDMYPDFMAELARTTKLEKQKTLRTHKQQRKPRKSKLMPFSRKPRKSHGVPTRS